MEKTAIGYERQQPDTHLILVGDKPSIEQKLANEYPMAFNRITICHSEEYIAMDDSPFSALRNKRHSSMRLAVDLVLPPFSTNGVIMLVRFYR